jgi:hypothetical protein
MRRSILLVLLGFCATAMTAQAVEDKQCKADPRGNAFGYLGFCGTATATVGVDGGTVSTPMGATVTLPFGAVDGPTVITIETSTVAPPRGALSPVYQFGPAGIVFARPVIVSLPMPPGVAEASSIFRKSEGPPSSGRSVAPSRTVSSRRERPTSVRRSLVRRVLSARSLVSVPSPGSPQ